MVDSQLKVKVASAIIAAAIFSNTSLHSASADNPAAEIMHFWVSGSESTALQSIRQAFEARGYTWVDSPQENNTTLRQTLVKRLAIGIPPTAIQWHANSEISDLANLGIIANIDDVATRENWDAILPEAVRQLITVDGSYYLAPTNIHGENWIYSSLPVLDRLGIEKPTTWPAFIDAFDRLAEAGIQPIAVGPGTWELRVMFSSILAGTLGRSNFRRLVENLDGSVLDTDGALEAFELMAKMRTYIQQDDRYDSWADASLAVAHGEAGFQFMGDWAKGEMLRDGARIGQEFACQLPPGSENTYLLVIDSFAFPPAPDLETDNLRQVLASTMLDRDVQVAFSASKGSVPVRLDTDQSELDACSQISLAQLHDPDALINPIPVGFPPAMAAEFQTIAGHYINHTNQTPQQGLAALKALMRNQSS